MAIILCIHLNISAANTENTSHPIANSISALFLTYGSYLTYQGYKTKGINQPTPQDQRWFSEIGKFQTGVGIAFLAIGSGIGCFYNKEKLFELVSKQSSKKSKEVPLK